MGARRCNYFSVFGRADSRVSVSLVLRQLRHFRSFSRHILEIFSDSKILTFVCPTAAALLGASSVSIAITKIMADSSLKLPRTLCFFLQEVCGQSVTLELRNKFVVSGVLDSVDPRMKYVGTLPH